MKKLIFLLFIIFSLNCYSQFIVSSSGGIVNISGCSYVHCNGFETQADDDDWTDVAGTPDYDEPVGGFDFEGSECMELIATESASIAVTARAETWITFMVRTNDNNESSENVILFYNNATLLGTLICDFDNQWKVKAEGGSTSGKETVNVNAATKYIKLRFKQGTGINAEIEFWASTDGQNWANNLVITDGTTTTQANKVVFQNTHDNEIMRFDNFMENSADITDAQ